MYEVRAILPKISIHKLNDVLVKMGFQTWAIAELKSYVRLTAFSNDAYAEITIFAPRVHIRLTVLPTTSKEIEKIIKNIMDSLVADHH